MKHKEDYNKLLKPFEILQPEFKLFNGITPPFFSVPTTSVEGGGIRYTPCHQLHRVASLKLEIFFLDGAVTKSAFVRIPNLTDFIEQLKILQDRWKIS